MTYRKVLGTLETSPRKWLVTGVAGFIGSHLLENLLMLGQTVVGLDNLATGLKSNLEEVRQQVGEDRWRRFAFHEGDICDLATCRRLMSGVDHVLHQAALGSVPRSVADPLATHAANATGFLNVILAAKDEQVRSFVYAASSSTYGDSPDLPKIEERIGRPLSPYAVTKYVNELYGDVFATTYGFPSVGLRYFNVFGPRQSPEGAYAAVIPSWIAAMLHDQDVFINGDGETSRDFCFVANVVQANLRAALAPEEARGQVYNVAVGASTTLNELFVALRNGLAELGIDYTRQPKHRAFRRGDVRHSRADISKAARLLGYAPTHSFHQGLEESLPWYVDRLGPHRREAAALATG